jgi:hypothetical protein
LRAIGDGLTREITGHVGPGGGQSANAITQPAEDGLQ